MSITTSTTYPTNSKKNDFFLIIRQIDLEFLDNNHCAASIMSVLRNAHKWKLETDARNKKANDIAEQHGDARWLSEDVLISFSISEIRDRILNLFGRNLVLEGLKALESRGISSTHTNPNKKYKHDQRRYFRYHPEVLTKWLAMCDQNDFDQQEELEVTEQISSEIDALSMVPQVIESSDSPNLNRRQFENKLVGSIEFKTKRPPFKIKPVIMNSNKYINNKNQSINVCDDLIGDKTKNSVADQSDLTQTILDALVAKGMSRSKFFPDTLASIQHLHMAGATISQFLDGYDIALHTTKGSGFGVNYLIKTVESLLVKAKRATCQQAEWSKSKSVTPASSAKEPVYENDFANAQSWAGDLL